MPLDVDAVTSPRYTREPLSLSLHYIGSFLRFHQQVEHNASLFKYVLERDAALSDGAKIGIFIETAKDLGRNYVKNHFMGKKAKKCLEGKGKVSIFAS